MDIFEAINKLNTSVKRKRVQEDLSDFGKRTAKDLYKDKIGYTKKAPVKMSTKDRLLLKKLAKQFEEDAWKGHLDYFKLVTDLKNSGISEDLLYPVFDYVKKLDKSGRIEDFSAEDCLNVVSGNSKFVTGSAKRTFGGSLQKIKYGEAPDIYKDFPFYVTTYAHDAVYEPAEGGYYVDTSETDEVKGFQTVEEAQKYADELAQEYSEYTGNRWGSSLDDVITGRSSVKGATDYHISGKYIGDAVDICIEDGKSLGKKEKHYYGYS